MASKAKRKTTPDAGMAKRKPERRDPDILTHFKATKPAPQIKLAAFHDGTRWCIKATDEGFRPFLFGGYAVDKRTAEWVAGNVAGSIGATLMKSAEETGATEPCEPKHIKPDGARAFALASGMESDMTSIGNLLNALHLIAEQLAGCDDNRAHGALYAIHNALHDHLKTVEAKHGEISHLTRGYRYAAGGARQ